MSDEDLDQQAIDQQQYAATGKLKLQFADGNYRCKWETSVSPDQWKRICAILGEPKFTD